MSDYIVGIDLGQANDYTAISVLRVAEVRHRATAEDARRSWEDHLRGICGLWRRRSLVQAGDVVSIENRYECVHLDRLPLGTPYPAVIEHTRTLLRTAPLIDSRTTLAVDATGVGRPVVDALRDAGLDPYPITITGGDSANRAPEGWRVPKRDLVAVLAVLLQTGRLEIAAGLRYAERLAEELAAFRVKYAPTSGHDSYGAWREGQHDDLVLAVAVAAWLGERIGIGGQGSAHWRIPAHR